MPYCTQCGRQLHDGEKCNCTSLPPTQGCSNAQQPYINGYPQQFGQNLNSSMQAPPPYYPPPYEPYPYQYISYPTPKKSNVLIWVVIIPVIFFVILTASILISAVRGYEKRARQREANNYAYNIRKAADQVLSELNREEENIKGLYIISSDSESNVAVPFDAGKFDRLINEYLDDADEREYFIIVRNGSVEYAAASKSWTKRSALVGTYPCDSSEPRRYSLNGLGRNTSKKDTLDTLYWFAYDEIFSDAIK